MSYRKQFWLKNLTEDEEDCWRTAGVTGRVGDDPDGLARDARRHELLSRGC